VVSGNGRLATNVGVAGPTSSLWKRRRNVNPHSTLLMFLAIYKHGWEESLPLLVVVWERMCHWILYHAMWTAIGIIPQNSIQVKCDMWFLGILTEKTYPGIPCFPG
jgi:hypothetical protein